MTNNSWQLKTPHLNGTNVEQKRAELKSYFHNTWQTYESLFSLINNDEAYFKRPEGAENSNAGGKSASPDINPVVGDTIYSDEAMTTLYVTNFPTLEQKLDFNINKGDFITIGPGSIIINTSCK